MRHTSAAPDQIVTFRGQEVVQAAAMAARVTAIAAVWVACPEGKA